ncbi:DUF1707 SHOCT-like domain-containing protein, partial [Streptosporangium lutulentum]
GRLTHEELDERLELALSSRTGRELALVGADLPDLYGSHPEDPEDAEDFRGRGGPGRAWRHGAGWGPGPHRHGPHRHDHHGHYPRWGAPHSAAWRHRHPARRGGPPFVPVLILLLVVGVATIGFGVLKFVLLAWLVMAVLGGIHRRRRHSGAGSRRIGRPGPF